MTDRLEWELDWIDRNPHKYLSPCHASHVKQCIRNRYEKIDLQRQLDVERQKNKEV